MTAGEVRCPMRAAQRPSSMRLPIPYWALLMDPAGRERLFDMRVAGIDPPGPAVVGRKVLRRNRRLRPDINLSVGLSVKEDLRCTPLDDTHAG
jgi:hypothetical protein